MMGNDLEKKVSGDYSGFKSKAEGKIAMFLENEGIRYRYEPAVMIDVNKNRPWIWYPDFHLPEYKAYIEYFGMVSDPCYKRQAKKKESLYLKQGLDMISIYPWMLKENWQGYILKRLKTGVTRTYKKMMTRLARPAYQQTGYHRRYPQGKGMY